MVKTSYLLAAAAMAALALSVPAARAGDKLAGQIGSFECGDNCYLTIITEEGTDLTGLCAAPACEPWNMEVAIPDDMIGRDVVATVGTGEQTDGAGTVMGSFISFLELEIADE